MAAQAGRLCFLFLDKSAAVDATRRNLPHWEQGRKLQFVTFRLGDSLPQSELRRLNAEKEEWLKRHPLPWTKETEAEYHRTFSQHIDRWLDRGAGSCILCDKHIAKIVEDALLFFEHKRYDIPAYVIMPNHVHLVVCAYDGYSLPSVLHSWKSFTAKQINAATNHEGRVWAEESFDRILRDEQHYQNLVDYIKKNIMQGGVLWRV